MTECTEEQQSAIAALLEKKMRDSHTVDELARMIRPCIGLTAADAKAVMRYYDNIVATYRNDHPRMGQDSIRQRARDAAQKCAERKHRQRALTIAQTESAFAYNKGADEGIWQAQEQNLIGEVKKRWSTSGDDRVCDICAALEGVEIDMDGEFGFRGRALFAGQKRLPPAHPRCACAVEYIEVSPAKLMASPTETGNRWVDGAINEYDGKLVGTNGDEAMSVRLLMSHDEVTYVKDTTLKHAFEYNLDKDSILYNPDAKHANKYDMWYALAHENAHRVDVLDLHSWENSRFVSAVSHTESLIMSNLGAIENLLQNESYRDDFAFNDLISALTKGAANDMLFVGREPDYYSSVFLRHAEVFADITCIDMSDSVIKREFDGLFKELYDAYKEVVAWKDPV